MKSIRILHFPKWKKHVCIYGGALVIVVGNGIGDQSSNTDEAVCISFHTNVLGKGTNPSVFLPTMIK